MSTGQIIGGVVGAVVSFFVPGAGTLAYASIGAALGGMLMPEKGPVVHGPRLDDLSVQTSTYGAVIPRVYGTITLNGNVLWLENNQLKETVTKKKSGGKGGGGTTTRSYSYSATFAVGLCKGPIIGVRRIWVGPNLIYDAGSTDPTTIAANIEAANGFEVYLGTDTQSPDPRMQATLGAANTPAWRGLAYIVFYDFQLEKYANSLAGAQVKVEVIAHGEETHLTEYSNTPYFGGQYDLRPGFSSWGGVAISVQPYPNDDYLHTTDGINWTATTFPTSRTWQAVVGNGSTMLVLSGPMYGTSVFMLRTVDGVNWTETVLPYAAYSKPVHNGVVWAVGYNGGCLVSVDDGINWTQYSIPGAPTPSGSVCHNGRVLLFYQGSSTYYTSDNNGVSWSTRTYSLGASTGIRSAASNGSVIVGIVSSTSDYVVSSDAGNTWSTRAPFYSGIYDWVNIGWGNGWFYAQASSSYVLSKTGYSWTRYTATVGSTYYSEGGTMAWSGSKFCTVATNSGTVCFTVQPGVMVGSDDTLSNVVSAECLQTSLLASGDIDVTELTPSVRGYRIGSVGAIRAALEPLRGAWPFDLIQSGYKLKFKMRGSASVITIPGEDLDARPSGSDAGVSLTTARESNTAIPNRVIVKYLDYDREYEDGEQYARRMTTLSTHLEVIDLPIVLTGTEAVGKAETLLYLRWLERYDVSFTIPATYNQLEPGDVIDVTTSEGNIPLRLVEINYTSDGRLECKAKYSSAAIYTPTSVAATPAVTGPSTIVGVGASNYQIMDVPMLSSAQASPSYLVAMSGALAGWSGGVLMQSTDSGSSWVSLQDFGAPGATMGTCTNTIGSVESRMIDSGSVLNVTLSQGDLYSVTELAMLGGSNYFAYGADGRWEIIAAKTCTLVSGKNYTLKNLLRGRFGTEWAMGTHQVGDSLILLDTTDTQILGSSTSAIGLAYLYRGVTLGRDISTDVNRSFTYRGVNLKPLSPVLLNGSIDPVSFDWSLTWVRRTRDGGEWRDMVDASLGESSEVYQVDVYTSGAYTTLKRTIDTTTTSCTYTSAQQISDFGGNQSTLYLKIYQMSSAVGRGTPLTTTITR